LNTFGSVRNSQPKTLLYGCGLRLSDCLGLRVQCFNLDAMLLTVHDGKGQKDRTVPLPERVVPGTREQMERVRRLHREDLAGCLPRLKRSF
jgi:integrase